MEQQQQRSSPNIQSENYNSGAGNNNSISNNNSINNNNNINNNNDNNSKELRSQSPATTHYDINTRVSSFSSAHFMHNHGTTARLPNPPTLIEWSGRRFLIMDAPSDGNIELYLRELCRYGVTDLVRVCDPTYSRETVESQGISVHEMLFPDGDGPPDSIVTNWLALVNSRFGPSNTDQIQPTNNTTDNPTTFVDSPSLPPPPTIAVHCVAGLGRAPVLVAIALVEAGMAPLDAVAFLRERRRGAINNKQLCFLESYRRRNRSDTKCLVM